MQRARFAVEEENVYVESVSAQIQEALAVPVNFALLVTKPVKKTGTVFSAIILTMHLMQYLTSAQPHALTYCIILTILQIASLDEATLESFP